MIDGLDSDDFALERPVVLVHVPEELELRSGRSNDENRIGLIEESCDLMEEPLRVIGALSDPFGAFRMLVDVVLGGLDRGFFDPIRVDVEYPGFLVVDPDGGVLAHDHFGSPGRVKHARDRPAYRVRRASSAARGCFRARARRWYRRRRNRD